MNVHYNDLYSVRGLDIIKSAKQGKDLVISFTNIRALGASCLDKLQDLLPLENVKLANISSFILKQFDDFFKLDYHLAENQTAQIKLSDYQIDKEPKEKLSVLKHSESDDGTIQLTFF